MNTSHDDYTPKLSVGLPVYNGENYLAEAIQSLRAQTYEDWELILADNNSSDGTREICREAERSDSRIKYYRHARNIGALKNFNFTLHQARGEYFKWAAHDDLLHPDFLERAVGALDEDPDVVLVFSDVADIDEAGDRIGVRGMRGRYDVSSPYKRFRTHFNERVRGEPIFGVARTEALRATGLLRDAPGSDVVVVAELLLHGIMKYFDEPLFWNRDHSDRYMRSEIMNPVERAAWFSPEAPILRVKTWDRFCWYLSAVWRAPITRLQRLRCMAFLLKWLVLKAPMLVKEFSERNQERRRLGSRQNIDHSA